MTTTETSPEQILQIFDTLNAHSHDWNLPEPKRKFVNDLYDKLLGIPEDQSPGVFPGKILEFAAGDGQAIYVVTEVLKTRVKMLHLNFGDAWTVRDYGTGGTVRKK